MQTTDAADELLRNMSETIRTFNRAYTLNKEQEQRRARVAMEKRCTASGTWPTYHPIEIQYNVKERLERPCYFCRSISVFDEGRNGFAAPRYRGYYGTDMGYGPKPHFACFDCRRGWKGLVPVTAQVRPVDQLTQTYSMNVCGSKCAICAKPGTYMGLNFRVPSPKDQREWARVQKILAENPVAFEAKCKCTLARGSNASGQIVGQKERWDTMETPMESAVASLVVEGQSHSFSIFHPPG
jgi:hypothetical protein